MPPSALPLAAVHRQAKDRLRRPCNKDKKIKTKKAPALCRCFFFMYVTRFELATFWSVARRSIQLSYTYNYLLFFNSEINNTSVYGFCQHLILKKRKIVLNRQSY